MKIKIIDHLNFLNAYNYSDKDKEEREVDEKKAFDRILHTFKDFILFTK